jgi:hypothetical protein
MNGAVFVVRYLTRTRAERAAVCQPSDTAPTFPSQLR